MARKNRTKVLWKRSTRKSGGAHVYYGEMRDGSKFPQYKIMREYKWGWATTYGRKVAVWVLFNRHGVRRWNQKFEWLLIRDYRTLKEAKAYAERLNVGKTRSIWAERTPPLR